MGRLIEGLWDCKHCQSKGIGGSKRECPHCGRPRDKDTKFYMPNQSKYVDEEIASTINKNPDWICQFCDSLNSASYNVCQSCGSARTSENLDYFGNKEIEEIQNSAESQNITDAIVKKSEDSTSSEGMSYESFDTVSDEYEDSQYLATTPETFIQKTKNVFGKVADVGSDFFEYHAKLLIIVGIVAAIIGIVWIFLPKTQTMTIENMYWNRSISIERYQTVDEEGWSLPEGARLHESKREIYTYEQVLDHYESKTRQVAKQRISHYEEKVVGHRDLGNGYFEEITERVPVYETYYETEYYQEPVYRSEPVYKTKYYYEIDKWLYDRSLTTSGYDKSPYWADTSDLESDERESTREEKYYISGTTSKGKLKEISMPYDEWCDLMIGDTVKVKVSIFGNGKLACIFLSEEVFYEPILLR